MMTETQPFRLATGGLVDRAAPLNFSFDGRAITGFAGDTLASALLANGVRLVGRSFKYHRPRGILSAGVEEPNALVEHRSGSRREPNSRATVLELYDGLVATSQNRWPSLRCDLLSVNSWVSSFIAAGFYYKTFMWPAPFWERIYEPMIRRAAGLGRTAPAHDPDTYEKATAFCDVLVIGGGPAGIAAAVAAGRTGARVILCDEDFVLGGGLLGEKAEIDGESGVDWAGTMARELAAMPEVSVMGRTSVTGVYDGGVFGAVQRVSDHLLEPPVHQPRLRFWRIVARRSVLAAGAIERPIAFGNNDRPGVMLAGSVRTYINRYGVAPGRRAVIFANNDGAAGTLDDLAAAGVGVAAVVDSRDGSSAAVSAAAARHGAVMHAGAMVTQAHGGHGLRSVEILTSDRQRERISCDLLAMSGGWNPTIHLTSHLSGRPRWDEAAAAFLPGSLPPGMTVAGAATGNGDLNACLASGAATGLAAAHDCGFSGRLPFWRGYGSGDGQSHRPVPPLWRVPGARGKAFIDFQSDVTTDDIDLSVREGFGAAEHVKRYTALGMATDQGKTSNVAALGILAEIAGTDIASQGTTTFRPPYTPVAIGALAGHARGMDFHPRRLSPAHPFETEQGAVFVEAGAWLRAQYYPRPGETWLQSAEREVRTVRGGAGICDVSTLGKIDIQGPDARAFIERIYCNNFAGLQPGRARYGLMLREDGFVLDDGVSMCFSDTHFVISTTTANAPVVMQHMEFHHQCVWPELDVQLTSVTEQWAQFSVAGPLSRELLRRVVDRQHDIANEALPFMSVAQVTVAGVTARLARVSFSGELAYEIAVPAQYGDSLLRELMRQGEAFGACLYGTEALAIMRIEKGHVAGGELNGHTTAADLGLGKMMSAKKDYVGRILAQRPALCDPERPTLVGLLPLDHGGQVRVGAHLVASGRVANLESDEGYVTSSAFSPMLGRWIALGLLASGNNRTGEIVRACDPLRGTESLVEICSPQFYDPTGERLHG